MRPEGRLPIRRNPISLWRAGRGCLASRLGPLTDRRLCAFPEEVRDAASASKAKSHSADD